MVKERNSGLDVARICAMCGIIILHILGAGGGIYTTKANINYWIIWWVEICAYCSVDLFAILSGWLGIKKEKYNVYRALELMAIVVFYCVLITVILILVQPNFFTDKSDIVKSLLPYLFGRYWYIICYIPIVILQPFINKMLLSLSRDQHRKFCFISVLIFSLIPTLLNNDFFVFNKGYSFVWLIICYVIGSYLKRVEDMINIDKTKCIFMFVACSGVLLAIKALYDIVFHVNRQYFVEYTSPLVLLMAVSLLLCTAQLEIKIGKRILKKMSMMAFDVYVIHCHILILDRIISGNFQWICNISFFLIPLVVIYIAILVFSILSLIGMIRDIIFQKLLIGSILKKIAVKIDEFILCDFD